MEIKTVSTMVECILDLKELSNEELANNPVLYTKALSTGFDDLDQLTGGIQPGLTVIAGRPGSGHECIQRNIIEQVALNEEHSVLHFECSDIAENFIQKIISSLGRVNYYHLQTSNLDDDEWARLAASSGIMVDKMKLLYCDGVKLTTKQIDNAVKESIKENGNISMISINWLQLIRTGKVHDSRYGEICEISRFLKSLAKKYSIPVLVTSTLNRKLEERADKRPVTYDLRDSGTIEDDANSILFTYNSALYDCDSEDKGTIEVIVAKNNGPIGCVKLLYQEQFCRADNYLK